MNISILLYITVFLFSPIISLVFVDDQMKWPTVFISVLVRNKAHTLPYFLTCLRNLDYPRDRLYIWIYTDHNSDDSIGILEKWSKEYAKEYKIVNVTAIQNSGQLHSDEEKSSHWSPEHFKHVIKLREEAFNLARREWADFIFMIDADVCLVDKLTMKHLVQKNLPVVAPMLMSDGIYSNFWCGMTENFYYKRTEDYKPILNGEKLGCFPVPMVHTAVLTNLNTVDSDHLTYDPNKIANYSGPLDDIIAFAINAKNNDIAMYICNNRVYGFVPVTLEDNGNPDHEFELFLNLKLEAIVKAKPLPLDPLLESHVVYPTKWKFGINEIFMINLERRAERRDLMMRSFRELGMDARVVKAVDGRTLDIDDLSEHSITLMPNYEDPHFKRPMKAGEVGCFLSHYKIWQEVVNNNLGTALVFEDDIHFMPFFRNRLLNLLHEIKNMDWDLVYIGRKILQDSDEVLVTKSLVRPLYSYWTLGYLVSRQGARKLLDAEPLTKMLPVDEFLPIMFDQHPNSTWKSYFKNRNLKAFSSVPLLVYPSRYTGDEDYISDTEASPLLLDINAVERNEL